MNINGNNVDLQTLYKEYKNDHREANLQAEKPKREYKNGKQGLKNPVKNISRFKLIVYWKNRPNNAVWIPGFDLNKGKNEEYYIDEHTSYKKLVYYITHTNYDKFNTAYIMMNIKDNPNFLEANYNHCVYMNVKNVEKQRYKGEKINILHWKANPKDLKRGEIVDRNKFININNCNKIENSYKTSGRSI
tara:strand:- start:581 stop:1147 length:567 start_codon:yes stop_codon:yes gene_type:complete